SGPNSVGDEPPHAAPKTTSTAVAARGWAAPIQRRRIDEAYSDAGREAPTIEKEILHARRAPRPTPEPRPRRLCRLDASRRSPAAARPRPLQELDALFRGRHGEREGVPAEGLRLPASARPRGLRAPAGRRVHPLRHRPWRRQRRRQGDVETDRAPPDRGPDGG